MSDLISIFGILMIIVIFGALIGFTIKYLNLSKKASAVVVLGNGIAILAGIYIASLNGDIIYKFVNDYNSTIFLLISVILLLSGAFSIKKLKKNQNKVQVPIFVFIAAYFGFVVYIIITLFQISPVLDVPILKIGIFTVFSLSLSVLAFYLTFNLKFFENNKVSINNLVLLIGFYFLANALLIPNIGEVLKSPMRPMDISSITSLFYVVVLVGFLLILGFYKNKKTNKVI